MTFTLRTEGKMVLAQKVRSAAFVVKNMDNNKSEITDAWDRLFALGDEIRKRTGVTRDDVKAIIAEVRACKS